MKNDSTGLARQREIKCSEERDSEREQTLPRFLL